MYSAMVLPSDLKKAYSISNLRNAWKRLLSSPDAEYKNYFRSLYKAYGLSSDENLYNLHYRLKNGLYAASRAIKIYTPKKSGLLRTISLLNLEDQIIYQAYANVIAEYLNKAASKNYGKLNFSNYYAGTTSSFFYKKWQYGYQSFTDNVKKTYRGGLVYSASFDYTAFYDTIDHSVLRRLLEDMGMSREFSLGLTGYLREWTCTDISRKHHSHGIPQGPISSAMIAEVLMNYVDNNFESAKIPVRYLRYADDIRLMSVDEVGVRKGVLSLDIISKRLGLFPQSGKLEIRKIISISDEIKNISVPDTILNTLKSKEDNFVNEYIKNGRVVDETKFKYFLSQASSNVILEARCLRIIVNQPHLLDVVLSYLSKNEKLSKSTSRRLFEYVQQNNLYEESIAKCLNIAYEKASISQYSQYTDFCLDLFPRLADSASPNLRIQLIKWLLRESHFKYGELLGIIADSEAWVICNILSFIDKKMYGQGALYYQLFVNGLLCSQEVEVSLSAAYLCVEVDVDVMMKPEAIGAIAQLTLNKAGKISKIFKPQSSISSSLKSIFKIDFIDCEWNGFLQNHAKAAEIQMFLCVAFVQTDVTVFFNKLSMLNELFVEHIFRVDSNMPKFMPGNIGGYINSRTCGFAKAHFPFYLLCETVQRIRRESDLAHAVNKQTKKPTSRILFSEFRKNKQVLIDGYNYLISFIAKNVPITRVKQKSLVQITSNDNGS